MNDTPHGLNNCANPAITTKRTKTNEITPTSQRSAKRVTASRVASRRLPLQKPL